MVVLLLKRFLELVSVLAHYHQPCLQLLCGAASFLPSYGYLCRLEAYTRQTI